MFKTMLTSALVAAGVLGLSACDVQKTQEGNVSLPKYDVQKKAEGDVTPPKFNVTGPDVNVGTKEATVKVPDVDVKTEQKTVTVPDVDIKTGQEKNRESQSMGAAGTKQ